MVVVSTTHRTDVHRPAELVTEHYVYVTSYDTHAHEMAARAMMAGAAPDMWAVEQLNLALEKVRTSSVNRGVGQCHHCGAHIRYGALLRHTSDEWIAVGETCLENRFERATADFQRLRKQAQLDRERQRIIGLRQAFVAEHPELAWMNDEATATETTSNRFVLDVARKLRNYGELSERQIAAVGTALERDAQRKAERENPPAEVPCPHADGTRTVVTGRIVATKWQESDYGSTLKMMMLIPADGGVWKLWATVPTALDKGTQHSDEIRGTEATIRVTIQRTDDPVFCRGKRPTVITS